VRHLHSLSLRVPTRRDAAIRFFFPLSQRGIEGDFFICHYPAANPGDCLGMPGESITGEGLRGSSIAIVRQKGVTSVSLTIILAGKDIQEWRKTIDIQTELPYIFLKRKQCLIKKLAPNMEE